MTTRTLLSLTITLGLAQTESRAQLFQAADPKQHPEIMFNSTHACTACHAQ